MYFPAADPESRALMKEEVFQRVGLLWFSKNLKEYSGPAFLHLGRKH